MSVAEFAPADHVTQREPGPWRDCTFASMLEVLRFGFVDGQSIPPTQAEKEAYRATAGLPDDHAGATLAVAIEAARERYNLGDGFTVTSSWADVRAGLMADDSWLVVQGSMAAVPARLRRWDPAFSGPHSVAARGVQQWCDPLAPKGTYVGEYVGLAAWEAFFKGLPGAQAFITRTGGLTRMAGDYIIDDDNVDCRKTGKPTDDTPFFNDRQLTDRRGKFSVWTRVRILGQRGEAFAVWVKTKQGYPDGIARNTLVFVAKTRMRAIAVEPDPTPYTQADVDAAYARGKAEGDVTHVAEFRVDGDIKYSETF